MGKKEISRKNRSESSDSSSSSSKRHSKKHSKRHSKRHSHKRHSHKKHSSKKHSSNKHSSNKHSSESHKEDKLACLKELYEHLKLDLLRDPELMVGGSDAHGCFYSTQAQSINPAEPIVFQQTQYAFNIDKGANGNTLYVRRDGVYLISLHITPDTTCQFTPFVNGIPQFDRTIGTANAAGQLTIVILIPLRRDDVLTIRNYSSTTSVVTISPIVGGTDLGANVDMVIKKIAPYPKEDCKCMDHEHFNKEEKLCIPRKLRKKFNLIKKWMLEDPQLMLQGSDAYGSFYSTLTQDVAVDAPVLYEKQLNVLNLESVPGSGDVKIKVDGVYLFTFMVETAQACQFTVFVNGVPDQTTTGGVNKGANVLQLKQEIQLKVGDVVSIRNHVSAAGTITVSQSAGGVLVGVNTILILYRVAPLFTVQKEIEPVPTKALEMNCDYKLFKKFLLDDRNLDLIGMSTYWIATASTLKSLNLEDAVIYNRLGPNRNVFFKTGTEELTVKETGIYKIIFDLEAKQPSQFTVYVNNLPIESTISGTNSGASQASIRQLLKLQKGDKLSVKNHSSYLNPVVTQMNPGGSQAGITITFLGLRIAPVIVPQEDTDKKPCKKNSDKPCKKNSDKPCKKNSDKPCKKNSDKPCKKNSDKPCKKNSDKKTKNIKKIM